MAVADGDTLTARCAHETIIVRLAEIDAPERRQPWGERSRQHLALLCHGQPAEVRETARDRWHRMVARVRCAGIDASEAQVRAGLAWRFARYSTDPGFESLEAAARAARTGLWSDPEPVPPWQWRRR